MKKPLLTPILVMIVVLVNLFFVTSSLIGRLTVHNNKFIITETTKKYVEVLEISDNKFYRQPLRIAFKKNYTVGDTLVLKYD
jgi:hypothetical protein